jgi:hypothetical protein
LTNFSPRKLPSPHKIKPSSEPSTNTEHLEIIPSVLFHPEISKLSNEILKIPSNKKSNSQESPNKSLYEIISSKIKFIKFEKPLNKEKSFTQEDEEELRYYMEKMGYDVEEFMRLSLKKEKNTTNKRNKQRNKGLN